MPDAQASEPTVLAMSAPTIRRRNPLLRSTSGLIGLAVLAVMAAACAFGSVWAFAPASAGEEPRYRESDPYRNNIPPLWAGDDATQRERKAEAFVRDHPEAAEAIAAERGVTVGELAALSEGPAYQAMRSSPGWPSFMLGSDVLGRSLLARVLLGGAISLGIGIAAAFVSVFIGTVYGAIAGYIGGATDAAMMRVVDVLYGLPYILLVVLLAVASDAVIDELATKGKARQAWIDGVAREMIRAEDGDGDVSLTRLAAFKTRAIGVLSEPALEVLAERLPPLADRVAEAAGDLAERADARSAEAETAGRGLRPADDDGAADDLAEALELAREAGTLAEQAAAERERAALLSDPPSYFEARAAAELSDALGGLGLIAVPQPEGKVLGLDRWVLDLLTLLVAIGAVSWLTLARVIRGQVLSLKEQPFIEAARAMGAGPARVFVRHLLPNLIGPIVVYATLSVPQAILQESFLSFLGIGVDPPLPSWGNLAAEGLPELNRHRSNWWLLAFPSALLAVTLLSLNFVGEGLREALDPKGSRNT